MPIPSLAPSCERMMRARRSAANSRYEIFNRKSMQAFFPRRATCADLRDDRMADSKCGTLRFSTRNMVEGERVRCWREHCYKLSLQLDVEPAYSIPLQACMMARSLPGLQLITGRMSPARISRSRELIADGNDDLVMVINQKSPLKVASAGKELILNEGEAILTASDEVTILDRNTSGRSLALRVRRAALSSMSMDVEQAFLRVVPRQEDALRLLAHYAEGLFTDVPLDPQFCNLAVSHVHDLIALAFGPRKQSSETTKTSALRDARRRAAKDFTVRNSSSRELNVVGVAQALGLTPRSLQRLFEADGTTFSEYLLKQRLARAYRMLSDMKHASLAVSTIAYDVGFGDLSYFNRSFRRVYGYTPRDLREGRS